MKNFSKLATFFLLVLGTALSVMIPLRHPKPLRRNDGGHWVRSLHAREAGVARAGLFHKRGEMSEEKELASFLNRLNREAGDDDVRILDVISRKGCKGLRGIAQTPERLYMLCSDNGDYIKIMETRSYTELGDVSVKDPVGRGFGKDLTVDPRTGDLFVSLKEGQSGEGSIWKVSTKDDYKVTRIAFVTMDTGRLSMTSDGHVLIVSNRGTLFRINSQGGVVAEVPLPRGVERGVQALETPEGNYIVIKEWMREIDRHGNLLRTFREFPGQTGMENKLTRAEYVTPVNGGPGAKLGQGYLVVDSYHDRLVFVSKDLRSSKVLLDAKDGLRTPDRVSYEPQDGRLVVARTHEKDSEITVFIFPE